MKKVLLLYGWHGSDAPHWQDWLAKSLIKEGYEVSFPQLSNKMTPKKEIWIEEAKKAYDTLKPDIVIAHSMGNILWMHLCFKGLVAEVKHLLMVAPPRDLSDIEAVRSFFPIPKVKELCSANTLMVASDNDPYRSLEESQGLSKALNCDIKILEKAGHINSDSGYGAWPWVLEWVREVSDS